MAGNFGGRGGRQDSRTKTLLAILGSGFLLLLVSLILLIAFYKKEPTAKPVTIENTASLDVKMVDVLVPSANIEQGIELTPKLFKVEQRPQYGLDDRVIKSFEAIRGFYARSLILAGQPLYQDHITNVKPNAVQLQIPEGYRAVTIRVNETSSVYGWAQPGSHVDVTWSGTIEGKTVLTTIVENVIVLSIDRLTGEVENGSPVPSTVTLSVRAEDSDRIQLAADHGILKLSLRNPDDIDGAQRRRPVGLDELLGRKPKDEAQKFTGKVTIGNEVYGLTADGGMVLLNGNQEK